MINFTKTIRIIAAIALVVLVVGAYNLPAAQGSQKATTGKDFTIGKKGVVHFNVPLKVGGAVLNPGMYQVQHMIEGGDHVIGFKEMEMPVGYRHSNTPVSKEAAAHIKCRVEGAKKVNNTTITLRVNAAGEKEIAEVQVAGEAFKHLL